MGGLYEISGFSPTTRLNQIQVIGTHNSYHIEPDPELLQALVARFGRATELRYSHTPLEQQLQLEQVRQLELDVYADPLGGLFRERAGLALIHRDIQSSEPKLDQPGFKVMHIPHIDYRTHCLTLKDGLTTIRDWSQANPGHIPVMVLIEVKGAFPEVMAELNCKQPIICGINELDALDQEIRSVFARDHLLLPDDIRRDCKTLKEGVLNLGWPRLSELGGKVFFALDNTDRIRDLYLQSCPSLEGRVMFTSSLPGTPSAAFIKANNPEGVNMEKIQEWVRQGYLVRTMADPPLNEIAAGNLERARAALESGAHFVSTDFPRPNPTGYEVRLSAKAKLPARLNPITSLG